MPFPRADLRELIQKLADAQTLWQGDPEPALGKRAGRPGTRLKLDVRGVHRKGVDEIRESLDTATQALRKSSNGYRVWSVSLRAETLDSSLPGYDILENVVARLSWPSSLAALREMGLAFAYSGDVVPVNFKVDGRDCNSAVVELTFGSANVLQITDEDGGWIETVNAPNNGDVPGPT